MSQEALFELSFPIINQSSSSQSQLETMARTIKHKAPFGPCGRGTTAVIDALDVANNPHYAYALMYNDTTSKIEIWDGNSWEPAPMGQIEAASQIDDEVITKEKLSLVGTSPKYILRVAVGGASLEWVPATSLFDNGTIPLAQLEGGTEGSIPRVVAGVKIWDTFTNIANAVLAAITSFDINKLSGKIASGILTTDASSNSVWQTAAAFIAGIANGSIGVAKINGAATARQVVMSDGSNAAWSTLPITRDATAWTSALLSDTTMFDGSPAPMSTGLYAALGSNKPKLIRIVLLNDSADLGYAAGDEVDANSLYDSNTTGNPFNVYWDASANDYIFVPAATSALTMVHATTGAYTGIDETKWRVRIYAYA